MRQQFSTQIGLALVASLIGSAAFAEELTTEEMVRRFELQGQTRSLAAPPAGGGTRGLSAVYGEQPSVPAPAVSESRGLRLIQGAENPVVEIPMEAVTLQPTVSLDGIPYSDQPVAVAPVETTPLMTDTGAYQQVTVPAPVAYETYQSVEEEARVDLRVYFEWNSASLKPEAIGQLSTLCSAINQVVGQRVFKIIGHTDKSGSDDYNLYLSEARAREVKRHLVDACGIPRDALIAVGEGERQADPNAPQRDPSGRRVEVQLVG